MLIIELILCSVAWSRGWKGWALLPVAIPFVVGMTMGASAESQADLEEMMVPGLIFEGLCMVGLLVMAIVGRRTARQQQGVEQTAETGVEPHTVGFTTSAPPAPEEGPREAAA